VEVRSLTVFCHASHSGFLGTYLVTKVSRSISKSVLIILKPPFWDPFTPFCDAFEAQFHGPTSPK